MLAFAGEPTQLIFSGVTRRKRAALFHADRRIIASECLRNRRLNTAISVSYICVPVRESSGAVEPQFGASRGGMKMPTRAQAAPARVATGGAREMTSHVGAVDDSCAAESFDSHRQACAESSSP